MKNPDCKGFPRGGMLWLTTEPIKLYIFYGLYSFNTDSLYLFCVLSLFLFVEKVPHYKLCSTCIQEKYISLNLLFLHWNYLKLWSKVFATMKLMM